MKGWQVAALGAVLAIALLISTVPEVGPFDPARVGSAGEWYAGIAAAFVLVWAIGEPKRQRRHEEWLHTITEADRRIAAARSVVLYDFRLDLDDSIQADGAFHVMRGEVGNFSATPIRILRVLIDWRDVNPRRANWHPDDVHQDTVALPVVGELSNFNLADVLEPEGHQFVVEHGRPIQVLLDERILEPQEAGTEKSQAARAISDVHLRFIDVHGDEWESYFGPDGHDVDLQLVRAKSGFWSADARDRLPVGARRTASQVE